MQVATDSVEEFQKADNRRCEAGVQNALLEANLAAGDVEKAMHAAKDATAAYRSIKDRVGEMRMLHIVAQLQMRRDQPDKAKTSAEQAMTIHKEIADPQERAMMMT